MKSLRLEIAPQAAQDIRGARRWQKSISPATEQRFTTRLTALLRNLCSELPEKIATGRPPQRDEKASLGLIRPAFQERFYTGAKKPTRRSSAGVWRVFYALLDADGDNQPEALLVLRVFHAAAELPWERIDQEEPEEDK
jgi:plasmid stabilization system protein ParE